MFIEVLGIYVCNVVECKCYVELFVKVYYQDMECVLVWVVVFEDVMCCFYLNEFVISFDGLFKVVVIFVVVEVNYLFNGSYVLVLGNVVQLFKFIKCGF